MRCHLVGSSLRVAGSLRSAPCLQRSGPISSDSTNLTRLTATNLKRILALLERKEALQAQVEGINRQLAAYESAGSDKQTEAGNVLPALPTPRRKPQISEAGRARIAAAQRARWPKVKGSAAAGKAVMKLVTPPKPAKARSPRRGQLKESVVALVREAGRGGIRVAEVAGRLGVKPRSIFDWFKSTGKGVKAIRKVGRARYGWQE